MLQIESVVWKTERSISEFRGKTQRGGLEEKDKRCEKKKRQEMWRPGPGQNVVDAAAD